MDRLNIFHLHGSMCTFHCSWAKTPLSWITPRIYHELIKWRLVCPSLHGTTSTCCSSSPGFYPWDASFKVKLQLPWHWGVALLFNASYCFTLGREAQHTQRMWFPAPMLSMLYWGGDLVSMFATTEKIYYKTIINDGKSAKILPSTIGSTIFRPIG